MSGEDLSNLSMFDLFRLEVETQAQALTAGLLALERTPAAADQLEACMRAAHSLKGAARIVDLEAAVRVAHAMEDGFVAAQQGRLVLRRDCIDLLFRGVDSLTRLAAGSEEEAAQRIEQTREETDSFLADLARVVEGGGAGAAPKEGPPSPPAHRGAPSGGARSIAVSSVGAPPVSLLPTALPGVLRTPSSLPRSTAPTFATAASPAGSREGSASPDRALRVTAQNLNRLLALAGESLVDSRSLKPFSEALLRLKRMHQELSRSLESLREALPERALGENAQVAFAHARQRLAECRQFLSERMAEMEMFDRRSANLSHRLYDEALACRMRPFADGVHGFPRLVRDLARSLGKQAKLEIVGEATPVDRDILEKLDALGHLLRNAVDHGIEAAEERRAAGKPEEGIVRLEARHSSGALQLTVSDDGRGIDPDALRREVIERNLASAETAQRLSESELLEFLFLPGFTMKKTVTEISGRGVGLDVVQAMLKGARGTVHILSRPGQGVRFQIQLPLTLSVVRTLLAEVGGEPYAFPLAHLVRTLKVPRNKIELLEGRQHFNFDGRQIGLVSAHQIFGGGSPKFAGDECPVIVVGDQGRTYGLVVDHFLGERELVVQPLDARLGKIKDIAAGALMEDGAPVMIVDVEDLIRSVEKLTAVGQLSPVLRGAKAEEVKRRKRVLVVDDSLTVREVERKLLDARGYEVEVAVDGMDGWNAVRGGRFDLVITDIDMPRIDGIELIALIKQDPHCKSLPVMIISYKDREEDRRRGLEAGADYYLAKSGFHDGTLLQAVEDLIGGPIS